YPTKKKVSVYAKPVNEKKLPDPNPLLLRSRLLFDASSDLDLDYYYMYSLGRAHSYGHKQHDTVLEKLAKTDLILGRRLSEAVFSILKVREKDPYLEELMANHRKAHPAEHTQPSIIRLDNVLTPKMRKRYQEMGSCAFAEIGSIKCTVTGNHTQISKSLIPPRQAIEAIRLFNSYKERLDDYCNNDLGDYVTCIDITDKLYVTVQTGNKKPVVKLLPTITNNTEYLEIPILFK